MKRRNIGYNVLFTTPECGATEQIKNLTQDGEPYTIIVLGGDGTINEVVNGIRHPEKITLGFIPSGSGNDFTRALKLPTAPRAALENVLQPGHVVPLDIGLARFRGKPHNFAVSCGIGFDASVCHYVEKSGFKAVLNRFNLGNLVYTGTALKRLFLDPLVDAEVVFDDGEPQKFSKMFFAAVMNHPYEGGGFFFCPEAKTDDGLLDVIVVAGVPRLKVLFVLPTAFFGKHTRVKGVHIQRCRRVSIRTSEPCPIHTDGEPVFVSDSLTAEVCPRQILVMTP